MEIMHTLQRAYKITNFVLHHGNNMLAVESLNGFSVREYFVAP